MKHIEYEDLKMQTYLCNPKLTFKQISIVCISIRDSKCIKSNLKTHYMDNILCHLRNTHDDTQEHCLKCEN